MTSRQRLACALVCAFWLTLAVAACALVTLGRAHINGLSMTLIVISGVAGLVGLVAAIATKRSRA